MTHREEEALRRALHAAADSLEPAADGLTRIRARLSPPRPLGVAWLTALWARLSGIAGARLEPALTWLAGQLPAAAGPLRAWFAGAGARHRRRRVWWQQPSVAISAVVVIAAAAGIMLSGLPSAITQGAAQNQSSHEGGGVSGQNGTGVNGSGQPYASPGTGKRGRTASPSASCSPSAAGTKKGTASPSPSSSASPSPSPSPTSTPSPTPTPTPTATASPDQTANPDQTSSGSGSQSAQAGTGGAAQTVSASQLGHSAADPEASPTPSPSCSPAG